MSVRAELGVVACVPKGQWHDYEEYEYLNIVTDNGSAYIAKKTVPVGALLTDTEYWDILVRKGDKGDAGEITDVTASVDNGIGTPSVVVTEGGTPSEKTIDLAFHNLKGNGVESIESEKTGQSGLVDTYTITFTYEDGSTDTIIYTVTNGQDGEIQGTVIAPAYDSTKAYKIGNLLTYLGKMYEVTGKDGVAPPVGTLPTDTDYFTERPVSEIIDMIKAGTIPVGLSDMAKNLTPYSEDSGAIQDTPFISQETGTANNSVIVTTGDKAKQLEKLGNAYVVNDQFKLSEFTAYATASGTDTDFTLTPLTDSSGIKCISKETIVGHTYLAMGTVDATNVVTGTNKSRIGFMAAGGLMKGGMIETEPQTKASGYVVYENAEANTFMVCRIGNDAQTTDSAEFTDVRFVDLTQWFNGNENIPADLLANPSHFSWYYNGELTYNAGNIQHGNGVKLVCTRGRNLWDEQWEVGSYNLTTGQKEANNNYFRSKNYILVIPNAPIFFKSSSQTLYYLEYDNEKNYIGYGIANGNSKIMGSTTHFITFVNVNTPTYAHNITITPYYTSEQGGEGYTDYYPYEEPDIIDTGSEQLGAFNKKTPDGVITRGGVSYTFTGTENWALGGSQTSAGMYRYYVPLDGMLSGLVVDGVCSKFVNVKSNWNTTTEESVFFGFNNTHMQYLSPTEKTLAEVKALFTGVTVEYPLATPTTEQGTSFRQYAGINDYGIMYWLNANDELVSIPQGCKIQYPVNYKGFIDDAYMYTNGDATAFAKNESITDAALNARGYYKLQDLLSVFGVKENAGGILRHMLADNDNDLSFANTNYVDLGSLTYTYNTNINAFVSNEVPGIKEGEFGVVPKVLCPLYNTVNYNDISANNMSIAVSTGKKLWIKNSTYTDATAFANAMKGIVCAYEKAST